jgi:MFS family permease
MHKNYWAFGGIVGVAVISFLEYLVVNNALPTIGNVFHISLVQLQLISNIYNIVLASTMILFGKLGDLFGYRKIFYSGIFFLIIGSFFAGIAPSFYILLIARGIQSIGISISLVLAPSLIQMIFKETSYKVMPIYATFTAFGLAAGPYLGGIIVAYLSWRWVFYVNIPFLIVAFFLCLPVIPEFKAKNIISQIDVWGNILLIISLSSLVFTLINISQKGLEQTSVLSLAIFIISTISLFYIEYRTKFPILDIKYFTKKYFTLAASVCFINGAIVSCGMFFSSIFLQCNLHISAPNTGIILLTFALPIIVFSPFVNRLVNKIGLAQTLLLGILCGFLAAITYILFVYFFSIPLCIIALILTGMCLSISNSVAPIAAIKGVGEDNSGVAIGTIFAIFNIMGAVTIAIASMIYHILTIRVSISHLNHPSIAFVGIFIFITFYSLIFVILSSIITIKIKHSEKKNTC